MYHKCLNVKRGISISFLLLTNVILLTHSVAFHHHHDGIPIASPAAHHDHDCSAHHHNDSQPVERCNHLHCPGNIEDCTLTTIYIRFDNVRQIVQLHSLDFDLSPCVFTLSPDYSAPHIADDVGLPFRQKPYLISYLSEYISQSLGLRAPPFC